MNIKRSQKFISEIARGVFAKNQCEHKELGEIEVRREENGFTQKVRQCKNCKVYIVESII